MKSTPHQNHRYRPDPYRDTDRSVRGSSRIFPVTDYSFQPVAGAIQPAAARPGKSPIPEVREFRNLSREFFGAETRREYAREAVAFILISLISAWPIVSMVRELIRLLK